MPVILIDDNERLAFTFSGATFFYRRLSAHENEAIYRKCTDRRGQTNFVKYNLERIKASALGWDEVMNAQSQTIPFRVELIEKLPDDLRNYWLEKLEESDPGHEVAERQKNSVVSSTPE